MKSPQFLMHLLTGAIGLALGLTLAANFRSGAANIPDAPAGNFTKESTAEIGRADTESETKIPTRTRARERKEEPKSSEPRVSIPLKNVVEILKEKDFNYSSDFNRLDYSMKKALVLLGATPVEQEEVLKLVKTSESEILAAEKNHMKLGEVTADLIKMDKSGMRGPADEIAGRTKDGIRATLPADLAEGLISAINWEEYYPTDDESSTQLKITRGRKGKLTAWEMQGGGGTGSGLDAEFEDDGTPLPAEKIFDDRWKPFLKGVTLLPKDDE